MITLASIYSFIHSLSSDYWMELGSECQVMAKQTKNPISAHCYKNGLFLKDKCLCQIKDTSFWKSTIAISTLKGICNEFSSVLLSSSQINNVTQRLFINHGSTTFSLGLYLITYINPLILICILPTRCYPSSTLHFSFLPNLLASPFLLLFPLSP